MIKSFKLLRDLGQFENGVLGGPITLDRLTLCHARNGRGKTTLATVLRSLANSDPDQLLERRRVNSVNKPQVVIQTKSTHGTVHFTDEKWNGEHPNVVVFDEEFIDQNVFSGLTVSPQHRQNLHDVILGREGVKLKKRLDEHVDQIEDCNSELRSKEAEIKAQIPGQLTVDEICALSRDPLIDEKIDSTEKLLQAANDRQSIQDAPTLKTLSLPQIDLARVEQVLQTGLDDIETEALKRVHEHIEHLGAGAEGWLSDGMRFANSGNGLGDDSSTLCPFCGQELEGSQLIETYRKYFGDEYKRLIRTIQELIDEISESLGDGRRASFEHELRVTNESRIYWREFVDVEPLSISTDAIFNDCTLVREGLLRVVETKKSAPLEHLSVSDDVNENVVRYNNHVTKMQHSMTTVDAINKRIDDFKAQLEASDVDELQRQLSRFQAVKNRHSPHVTSLCDDYLIARAQKANVESARDTTRLKLDEYRRSTFNRCQETVNRYLSTFGAHFRLGGLKPVNIRSGSTTTYGAVINRTSVGVFGKSSGEPEPSFRTVFSAGDRATLALAFFFSSIDQMGKHEDLVVVLDDPISSMDEGRTLATAQAIRQLAKRSAQVIVFSHDKAFLCRMWTGRGDLDVASIQIVRRGEGSTLEKWDVAEESLYDHDRRDSLFNSFLCNGQGNEREIAREIRNHLEGYLRVACPGAFPPNTALGSRFIDKCRKRLGTHEEILSPEKLNELCDLLEYANSFHHDSNSAWESQDVNSDELRAYVHRTLAFAKP